MKSIDSIKGLKEGTMVSIALKANAVKGTGYMVPVDYYAEDSENETNIPGRHVVGHYIGKPHPSFEGYIPIVPDWNFETGKPGRDFSGVHIKLSVIEDYSILEPKK